MTARKWYVVRTNIRCEDRAAGGLSAAGYDVFLPKMRIEVVHQRTKKFIVKERILFNRYLFAALPEIDADWYTLRATDGVECVLMQNGKYQAVPDADVERFRGAQADMLFDETREARIHRKEMGRTKREETLMRFPIGSWVKIKREHTFGGFYGQVTDINGRGAIMAMLQIFGGLVPAELSAGDADPANVDVKAKAA